MNRHLTKRRLACYLLYFTLACTAVFGTTYARYGSAVSGTGLAQAAAVEMNTTLDLTDQLRGLIPGGEKEILFLVGNARDDIISEVAQEYSITVATTGNLPLTFELTHAGSGAQKGVLATAAKANGKFPFTWEGGELPHTERASHTYALIVRWPPDSAQGRYADEIDLVTLRVDAKQAGA